MFLMRSFIIEEQEDRFNKPVLALDSTNERYSFKNVGMCRLITKKEISKFYNSISKCCNNDSSHSNELYNRMVIFRC
jgi:hypothetical protein